MIDLFGRFNEKANRNDKGVFSFNLFLILFCLQSAKCHVTEFRNVWLALLKWLGFCLGTKKDVAKKSRATHNVIAAWHTEAEKSTHTIDVCASFNGGAQSFCPVLDHRGTMEARRLAHRERAKKRRGPLPPAWGKEIAPVFLRWTSVSVEPPKNIEEQRQIITGTMSRRSQQSLLNRVEKERAGPAIPDPEEVWSAVLRDFYFNLHHWHNEWRKNPLLSEQLILRIDLQFEVIRRALEQQPAVGERRMKVRRQIEALSFMFASVSSLLNWPEVNILF